MSLASGEYYTLSLKQPFDSLITSYIITGHHVYTKPKYYVTMPIHLPCAHLLHNLNDYFSKTIKKQACLHHNVLHI